METQNKCSLKQKWFNFCKAFLSPVPIVSILAAMVLIVLSVVYKDEVKFAILINLIGSLLIGIAGAFIKSGYDELSRESILIEKGRSAIRNLESISQQIAQIKGWIQIFLRNREDKKRALEEIDRHLGTAKMNIGSGLEDWSDVVPELKRKVEQMKEAEIYFQDTLQAYTEEFLKTKKALLTTDGQNQELKERLEERLKELERAVKDLKNEQGQQLLNRQFNLSNIYSNGEMKLCSKCGHVYSGPSSSSFDVKSCHSLQDDNVCPSCKTSFKKIDDKL